MKDLKVVGVGALVALIVALAVTYFSAPLKVVVQEQLGGRVGPKGTDEISCIGGYCSAVKVGTCGDATTTLVSVLNPFGATTTFGGIDLRGTNGSTSVVILVGTSSTDFVNITANLASPTMVSSSSIPARQLFYLADGNGPQSTSSPLGGFEPTSGVFASDLGNILTYSNATGSKILLGPTDRVVVQATSTSGASNVITLRGVTGVGAGDTNTFSCTYAVKFNGLIK